MPITPKANEITNIKNFLFFLWMKKSIHPKMIPIHTNDSVKESAPNTVNMRDEQLADIKNKLAASIGIEPQIIEKDVAQKVPVEAPGVAIPAEPQKRCDAEVQELMIRAERAEALLEEYRELYKQMLAKV